MLLLNLGVILDRMPSQTSKKSFRYVISLGMKIWFNLKLESKINKLPSLQPGDFNLNKF